MKLLIHSPAKALNKAYLRQSLRRDQVELFKSGSTLNFIAPDSPDVPQLEAEIDRLVYAL